MISNRSWIFDLIAVICRPPKYNRDSGFTVSPVKPSGLCGSWLSDRMRAARRKCHKAEHKGKKDMLQFSFEILTDCLRCYQKSVKEEKEENMSDIIVSNRRISCTF